VSVGRDGAPTEQATANTPVRQPAHSSARLGPWGRAPAMDLDRSCGAFTATATPHHCSRLWG
jgi:hypothetical protein